MGSVRGWPASRSSSLSSFDSDSDYSDSTSSNSEQVHTNNCFKRDKARNRYSPAIDVLAHKQSLPKPLSERHGIAIPNNTAPTCESTEAICTPPLTPDTSNVAGLRTSTSLSHGVQDQAAYDFLVRLFPGSARVALQYAKSVHITSSELSISVDDMDKFAFEGVVLELPNRPRTLYIDGKGAENVKLRERYVVTKQCFAVTHTLH